MEVNWSTCEIVSLQLTGVEVCVEQGHVNVHQKGRNCRFRLSQIPLDSLWKQIDLPVKWTPNTSYTILCNTYCNSEITGLEPFHLWQNVDVYTYKKNYYVQIKTIRFCYQQDLTIQQVASILFTLAQIILP